MTAVLKFGRKRISARAKQNLLGQPGQASSRCG